MVGLLGNIGNYKGTIGNGGGGLLADWLFGFARPEHRRVRMEEQKYEEAKAREAAALDYWMGETNNPSGINPLEISAKAKMTGPTGADQAPTVAAPASTYYKPRQGLLDKFSENSRPFMQGLAMADPLAALTSAWDVMKPKDPLVTKAGDIVRDGNDPSKILFENPDRPILVGPGQTLVGQVGQGGATQTPMSSTGAAPSFDNFYSQYLARAEGGYTGDDGNGHPANFGINQGANPGVDVKNLTQDQAKKILHDKYWAPSGADKLPPALAAIHGDTAVNFGVSRANQLLQQSGGDPGKYLQLRAQAYQGMAGKNTAKLRGWMNRNNALAQYASGLGSQQQAGGQQGQGGYTELYKGPDDAGRSFQQSNPIKTPDGRTVLGRYNPNNGEYEVKRGGKWVPAPEGSRAVTAGTGGAMTAKQFYELRNDFVQETQALNRLNKYGQTVGGMNVGIKRWGDQVSAKAKTLFNSGKLNPQEFATMTAQGQQQALLGLFRVDIVGPGVMTEYDAQRVIEGLGGNIDGLQNPAVVHHLLSSIYQDKVERVQLMRDEVARNSEFFGTQPMPINAPQTYQGDQNRGSGWQQPAARAGGGRTIRYDRNGKRIK